MVSASVQQRWPTRRRQMAVPTYQQFTDPLLRVLVAHYPEHLSKTDACELTADRVALSPEDRLLTIPSEKQALYKNRIGWAQDSLKRGLYVSAPKLGYWQATAMGVALAAEFASGLTEAKAKAIATAKSTVKMADILAGLGSGLAVLPDDPPPPAGAVTPEDRIASARAQIRERTLTDILELLATVTPTQFEDIVLDVLYKMGYGESREALERVGRAGDGGIDGIVPLDKLGLQKVYVQAKRWASNVGTGEILNFIGALGTKGADKGVIMTTSDFTKGAREVLGHSKHNIALVNGRKLAELMIDNGVGVISKTFSLPEISKDYFNP